MLRYYSYNVVSSVLSFLLFNFSYHFSFAQDKFREMLNGEKEEEKRIDYKALKMYILNKIDIRILISIISACHGAE